MTTLPRLTMVLGGAASGKSAFAEKTALLAGSNEKCYIATAQAFDDEMHTKIARHKSTRAADGWTTLEQPLEVAALLPTIPAEQVALLDCATLWLTNHLLAGSDLARVSTDLIAALARCPAPVVVVTNEVGQGIVPEHAMSRQFREAQGVLNQMIAREAQLVVQVIAGLPQVLKGKLPEGLS